MNRQTAEKTIAEYLKPIYGFALKRCKSIEDAEDLSQEIVLKAFHALLNKNNIDNVSKFIWTIAHNALSNYYRDNTKSMVGVSIDEVAELIADPNAEIDADDNSETIRRLQSEIAYLLKLQRKIVIAYYFENRKQADIAKSLDIPLGTVKWHLFEAKKELKRGIDTMRKTSELKFNPIHFHSFGINGSMVVILENKNMSDRLLAIGERIKKKYKAEFDAIKTPYAQAVLNIVPTHLRKIKEYELQFVFHADGWFLLPCIVCLLNNGKLKEPTEGQRKSLTTLITKR